jgi:F-type H+-transporting ATPase subunit b
MRFRTKRLLSSSLVNAGVCLALPTALLASESAEGGWGSLLDIGKAANLILVLTVLVWMARKPLANFFASRSQAIKDQLAEAQKARLEAETRLAEINSRMSSLEEELLGIRAVAEREAQQEYQLLIANAERDAQKIMERTRREIEGMTRTAQLELRAHVSELSVRLARQKIQSEMTDDDHRRLFTRFVAGLGGKE